MPEPVDYDIKTPDDLPPPVFAAPPRPSRAPWVAGIAVVAVLGVAAYYLLFGRPTTSIAVTEAPGSPAPAAEESPLGGLAETIELPHLDETDGLVRGLVGVLSSHPKVAAWMATNGLIRNFVVVVENISMGSLASRHLRVLGPAGPFRVVERRGHLYVDQRSYARHDTVADAVATIDAAGAARLYATLKPRIEEAYAELGRQESIDRALERAVVLLLRTPVVQLEVEVDPARVGYRIADVRIESLNASQKQLLRMGPRNMRIIQDKLREVALALGIPAERLPPVAG